MIRFGLRGSPDYSELTGLIMMVRFPMIGSRGNGRVDEPKSCQVSRLKEVFTCKAITKYWVWVVNDSQGEGIRVTLDLGLILDSAFTDNQSRLHG